MNDRLKLPSAIVFLSNACIMIIELVAGRILAPEIGVSLYTWTSIIGVILAGISAGNFLGGRLADQYASRKLLGLMFMVSAVLTVAIIPVSGVADPLMGITALPLIVRIVLITTVVFVPPAVVLGTISPIVVKLTLNDLEQSGSTIGRIYAMSSVGAIVGTFLTGFFLISLIGVYQILLTVALGLTVLGFVVASSGVMRLRMTAVVLLAMLPAGGYAKTSALCTKETNYFCIRLAEADLWGKQVKVLQLDRMIHTVVDEDPSKLAYPYEIAHAEIIKNTIDTSKPFRSVVLGGGGFAFPRYLETVYPHSDVVTVEIDPGLVSLARQVGWLPKDTKVKVVAQDARLYVEGLPADERFDVIIGDVFNDYSVPYHLTTKEFAAKLATHMTPEGIYIVNMIDSKSGDFTFLRSFVTTLREVFPHVYILPVEGGWKDKQAPPPTIELIASRRPLDLSALKVPVFDPNTTPGRLLTAAEMDELMRGQATILTDSFAPTDVMLAPVFGAALK